MIDTHLRMGLRLKDFLHHLLRPRAHRGRPLDQSRGWPVQMGTVRSGPMLVISHRYVRFGRAHVRGDTLALMEDLYGRGRGPHLHRLPRQLIGHTVKALIELDVIVDVDRGL